MSASPIVLYATKGSPFSDKIANTLALKQVPYLRVDLSKTIPRPELLDLGIEYRRIPLLAIGNDVYCDTSLITSALERHFPPSKGYPSLFPPRKGGGRADTGLMKAFCMTYPDRVIFHLVASCVPFAKFPESFRKDRSDYLGAEIDPQKLESNIPSVKATLSAHLGLVEEQLSDGREWLFDTESPSFADISTQFVFAWSIGLDSLKDLWDPKSFPETLQWINRVNEFLQSLNNTNATLYEKESGEDPASIIRSSDAKDEVGFNEVDAARLGLHKGQVVSVAPTDTGRNHLTTGKLIGLGSEEFVLEVKGSGDPVRCHLPRLNFSIKAATPQS